MHAIKHLVDGSAAFHDDRREWGKWETGQRDRASWGPCSSGCFKSNMFQSRANTITLCSYLFNTSEATWVQNGSDLMVRLESLWQRALTGDISWFYFHRMKRTKSLACVWLSKLTCAAQSSTRFLCVSTSRMRSACFWGLDPGGVPTSESCEAGWGREKWKHGKMVSLAVCRVGWRFFFQKTIQMFSLCSFLNTQRTWCDFGPFNFRSMHCWPNMQEQSNLASWYVSQLHTPRQCGVLVMLSCSYWGWLSTNACARSTGTGFQLAELQIGNLSYLESPWYSSPTYHIGYRWMNIVWLQPKKGAETFQNVMLCCEMLLGFSGRARRHRSHPSKGKVAVLCPVHRCRSVQCFSKNICRLNWQAAAEVAMRRGPACI